MKIEIKRWDNGNIIYSHSQKKNTIKITLERGVKEKVSFNYAELNYAELNRAKLNYAELNDAELNNAKFYYAELPKDNIIINDRWHIHITKEYVKIGCQKKPKIWWNKLTEEIAEKEFSAGGWWKQWKNIILAIADEIGDKNDSKN